MAFVSAIVLGGTGGVSPCTAQPARAGSVSGSVVDASTGLPLAGAVVTLEPLPGGVVPDPRVGARMGWTVVTREDGAYQFADVTAGTYRLRVERIGYRGAVVEAAVRRPADARLSVGLDLAPVALAAVRVEQRAEPPFRRTAIGPIDGDAARLALERTRQATFLTPDARMLTYADLVDGVTLGESDVFRALHRLPGVATRDDYTAELWTRGAPWSHTGVTFDGLPLFNPVHAVGVFTGLTPEILGAVFFHPGVRPASIGGSAAGAVDLRTRAAGGSGEVRGAVDLSMASARVALEQRIGEDGGWVVAARRSYLDVLSGGLDWLDLGDIDLPYAFHDVATRLDARLGQRTTLEASGVWEQDRLFGDVEGVVESTSARWGNTAGRLTLATRLAGATLRTTAGASRYRAHTWPTGSFDRDDVPPWVEPPSDNALTDVRLSGSLEPDLDGGPVPAWRAGYDLVSQHSDYDGPEPRYHPVKPDTTRRITASGRTATGAVWGEARWSAGILAVSPGLRVEGGSAAGGLGRIRVAPRVAARLAVSSELSISAAAGRSIQYVQALALSGPSAHPAFHAGQFWIAADADAPALVSDLVTIGAEHWLGHGFLAAVTGYARRSRGVAVPDPSPGPIARRPLYVVGENEAWGIDASLRRIAGRWTTSLAYAYGESMMDAAGLRFPGSADRRHRLDVLAAVRLTHSLRTGLAFAAMSGAPFTRAISRATAAECTHFGFGCAGPVAMVQAPNALRTPDYRSLDALVQWSRTMGDVEVGAYVQVRNVLGRDNTSTYAGSVMRTRRARDGEEVRSWDDRFEVGLPRLPLLGARIAF
jgi:hypothetical protein